MHAATRSIIAAAGLAAIGLVAWPHQATPPQAQQGVPTVHRDVALVDNILTPETTFDSELFNSVLGPTGAEEQLFTALGPTEGPLLLDTDGASPEFSGVFNGAESRLFEGLFINTLASEDQLNQLLGVTELNSQTAILADLVDNPGPSIPAGADVTLTDLTNAVGTSAFDTDLTQIANADYTFASGDFTGYLEYLATLGTSASDVSGLVGDLGSGLDLGSLVGDLGSGLDLGSLGGDLTTILGGLL
jgi:hypothetical protein